MTLRDDLTRLCEEWERKIHSDLHDNERYRLQVCLAALREVLSRVRACEGGAMTNEELKRLCEAAWPAPWVAHTFEIDCPCPNGEHCGDTHTCEQVEAPEAYPASPADPAAPGYGQCVVQISVPGLESLARPTAEFIAAARSEVPRLLARVEELEGALRECLHALDFEWPDCDGCKGDPHPCTRCRARAALGEEER